MKKNAIGIKKWDVIIILSFVIVTLVWFCFGFIDTGKKVSASVYMNGEEVYAVSLNDINESYEKEFNGCKLLFESDGVTFESSDCKNQLCVHEGKLKNSGATMACVPNGVVVVLKSTTESFDIVSY